ncbi:group III truncated hemoglobin [Lacibacterium aquatile]|uniref:Group III truncated hemoglobin n=1 Tax=Lacibacterium aquatile TaxID=1168082 RepID=A0ABW5DQ49_9PROT
MDDEFSRVSLHRLITNFYTRLRADPDLGPIFVGRLGDGDWSEHFEKLVDFWSDILLKTKLYNGRPMPAHMAVPGISPDHFPLWLGHFGEVARETFTPPLADELVNRADMIARGLQMGLFYRPGIPVVN